MRRSTLVAAEPDVQPEGSSRRGEAIERYKLADSGKMIKVLILVDDPGAFTTPWSAIQRFQRAPREWSEDICAENIFDFLLQHEVVPPPQADKPDF